MTRAKMSGIYPYSGRCVSVSCAQGDGERSPGSDPVRRQGCIRAVEQIRTMDTNRAGTAQQEPPQIPGLDSAPKATPRSTGWCEIDQRRLLANYRPVSRESPVREFFTRRYPG